MEKPCEFCAESRPVVYCKADAAHLCLSCDARVHSANALSQRHYRALLCGGCRNHPASIWCFDHRMFMCHGCDENLHEASAQHQKRVMSSYMGCPSARDFAVLWGYDWNELQPNDSQAVTLPASTGSLAPSASNLNGSREFCRWMEGSSLTYEANSTKSPFGADDEVGSNNSQSKTMCENQLQKDSLLILKQILDLERLQLNERSNQSSLIRSKVQSGNASVPLSEDLDQNCQHPQGFGADLQQMKRMQHELVQPFPLPFSQTEVLNSSSNSGIQLHGDTFWQCKSPAQTSQLWSQNMQDLGSCEEIDCNDGFKLPDVDLTFQNYEELFGGGQDLTRLVLDENDVACSSIKKDVSFGRTDNGYGKAMEDISVTQSIYIPQSSLEKRNIGPFDQAHHFSGNMDCAYTICPSYSSLMFSHSSLSAESSVADCLDSELSPNIMKGEPPWNSPELDNAHSAARENAMIRYKKKKKVRMYGKRT